jgi:CheY-like chemotaxis protein/anti-sigma regulatory factor (Ser/Thr protein kinase)
VIITDEEKIYAILTNLIKNAIKFTDKGSVEFGCEKKGAVLEFYVKDTGIGIPRNRQEAVFERFVQADINDKRAFQGSGLGLTIAKSYVEILGGTIKLESEEDKGSKFYFSIPYVAANRNNGDETTGSTPAAKHDDVRKDLKILIAEDDDKSEMLIRITIKKFCREILTAATGTKTVELCRNHPDIDLILMDVKMPEMNGYEATKQIRKFNKDVVIVAQTAYALTGEREIIMQSGCNDYVAKPFKPETLMALLKKYFQRHK